MSKRGKGWLRGQRVWLALSIVPASTVLMMWAVGWFRTVEIDFAIAPYSYQLEFKSDAFTMERTLNALRTQWTGLHLEPSGKFEREFWESWYRVNTEDTIWPLLRYHIGYAVSKETEQIDPTYVVTPSDLIVVPYLESTLTATSVPLLLGAAMLAGRLRLQNR